MNYLIVVCLVLLSGLFSGLTLGLLSLDVDELKRKVSLGNKNARKVLAIRERGNLLLCTLLLGNVSVNSTLAIFLGDIANGIMAGFIATTLIVIFGEIIPQASFSRHALRIGASTAWLVRIFIILFFPICWPISWALDKFLGAEISTIYSKKELMKIVEEHGAHSGSDIDADEERIIKGALSYSNKTVEEIMTPRTIVYALDIETILNKEKLEEIKIEAFTRIPIFKNTIDNMLGILYVKDLINIKPGIRIKSVYQKEKSLFIKKDLHLDELFNLFIESKSHIAFIKDEYQGLEGVATLEDVLEEILRVEIVDETDTVVDLRKEARAN